MTEAEITGVSLVIAAFIAFAGAWLAARIHANQKVEAIRVDHLMDFVREFVASTNPDLFDSKPSFRKVFNRLNKCLDAIGMYHASNDQIDTELYSKAKTHFKNLRFWVESRDPSKVEGLYKQAKESHSKLLKAACLIREKYHNVSFCLL